MLEKNSKSNSKNKLTIRKYSGFTTTEVEKHTKVSARKIRWWDNQGLVKPTGFRKKGSKTARRYSLRDIICILVIKELRSNGLSLQKIKKSIKGARHAGIENPLAQLRVACFGGTVFYKKGGRYYDPISGQFAFDQVLNQIRPRTEPQHFARAKRAVVSSSKYYEKKVAGL